MTMPTEKPLGLTPRTNENRRASKPLMEKRRRARINHSLAELKSLILDAVKKDSQNTRHSKLEKADILEMTVKHMQTLHRRQLAAAAPPEATAEGKFRAGFAECVKEVSRFVMKAEGVDPTVRCRLMTHLANYMTTLPEGESIPSSEEPGSGQSTASCTPVKIEIPPGSGGLPCYTSPNSSCAQPLSGAVATPPTAVTGAIPLIASRLPSGQLAFILPGSYVDPHPSQCYPAGPLDLATSRRHEEAGDRESTSSSPLSACSTPSSEQGLFGREYPSDSEASSSDRPHDPLMDAVSMRREDCENDFRHHQGPSESPMSLDPVWRPW